MNERIRELMIRAISDVDSIDDPETRRMYIPNCFAEKFAELIVRECLSVCQKVHDDFDVGSQKFNIDWMQRQIAINICKSQIKQHFGVEQ